MSLLHHIGPSRNFEQVYKSGLSKHIWNKVISMMRLLRWILYHLTGTPQTYVCWYIPRTSLPSWSVWTWLSFYCVLLGIFLGWENLNFRIMNCWMSWVRLFSSCLVVILGTVAHRTTYRSNNVRNGISSKVWGCCQYIVKKHSAAYCLWVKTCKRYFKSALRIQDEYSESIHDACHVYLSALYYVSGANQEKTTKHILKAENGTSTRSFLKPQILSYSSLRFVDTVAHVCGFCFLFDHVLQNQNKSTENGFTLSAIVQCMILSVSRINNTNLSNKLDRKEMTKHNFTSLFDICLWAVSVHKYRRTDSIC